MLQTVVLWIENPNFTVDMDKLLETKSKVVNTLLVVLQDFFVATELLVHKVLVPLLKTRMSW